jgi:hypothetical protein
VIESLMTEELTRKIVAWATEITSAPPSFRQTARATPTSPSAAAELIRSRGWSDAATGKALMVPDGERPQQVSGMPHSSFAVEKARRLGFID